MKADLPSSPIVKFRRAISFIHPWMLLLIAVLTTTAASKPTATKAATAKPTKADDGFKPFAVITQQNIFNTHRNLPSPPAPSAPKPPRPPKVEALTLLGTMSSERGAVAFFDGTSPVFRKAAQTGDKLGAYTLTAIEHGRVMLQIGERELWLPLKMQCYREDQGEWQIAALPDDFQGTAPPSGPALLARKPESKTASPAQIRDYVASKYERKLEQLANDPVKAEKLLKAMNGEVEGRIKKLEKLNSRTP